MFSFWNLISLSIYGFLFVLLICAENGNCIEMIDFYLQGNKNKLPLKHG